MYYTYAIVIQAEPITIRDKNNYYNEYEYHPQASGAKLKPGARVTNSEMGKSSAIMCRFGLVWFGLVWFGTLSGLDFELLADVNKFRGWTGD